MCVFVCLSLHVIWSFFTVERKNNKVLAVGIRIDLALFCRAVLSFRNADFVHMLQPVSFLLPVRPPSEVAPKQALGRLSVARVGNTQ